MMNFKVNPSLLWGAVFSVPAAVVDKYIRIASPEQIKALLWVLRYASDEPDIADLCKVLSCENGDAVDYLSFWAERGILIADNAQVVASPLFKAEEPANVQETPMSAPKKFEALPISKPTNDQILKRSCESPEISFLFSEAQAKLGRTIGFDGQCTLLMLHDQYGLSVEVILMIIEYCVSVSKTHTAYISTMGKSWAEREIDTIEKADEQIAILRRCNGAWREFASLAGIANPRPTASQSEYLNTWINELKFSIEMIFLAYEEMANHCTKLSFSYMNKILRNWHESGLKSPEEVAANTKEYREKKYAKQDKDKAKSDASYDIEEYKRSAISDPLIYKKKKKQSTK